jgi:apolipoprotein N-acyltransferase
MRKKISVGLLIIVSILFLSFSWPPYPLFFLIFFGLVPVFILEKKLSGILSRSLVVFLILFFWQSISLFWLYQAKPIAGFVATIFNSFFLTIPFTIYFLSKGKKKLLRYTLLISSFLFIENIHFISDLGFPFFTLGNGLSMYPSLIQWFEYTGVQGGTLWILIVNILVFEMTSSVLSKRQMILCSFAIIAPIVISSVLYFNYTESTKVLNVVSLHPNTSVDVKYTIDTRELIDEYVSITDSIINNETDLLVWPESAIPNGGWIEDLHVNEDFEYLRQQFNDYPNLNLNTGLIIRELYYANNFENDQYDLLYLESHDMYYNTYSAAMNVNNNNRERMRFKSRLVPVEERIPYAKYLGFLRDVIGSFGGYRFATVQDQDHVFDVNDSKCGYLICYETFFHSPANEMIDQGAEIFAIGLNEAWYDNLIASNQFLHFSTIRAIEYRRPIIRSSNYGVTSLTNSRGDIISSTDARKFSYIKGSITVSNKITFFKRYWWSLKWIFIAVFSLTLFTVFFKKNDIGS